MKLSDRLDYWDHDIKTDRVTDMRIKVMIDRQSDRHEV